jgi:nucleotide-binding universal stress UspA family protein
LLEVEMAEAQERRRLIMVGVDGSPEAVRALSWAIHIAQDLRGEVAAVHVLETQFVAYYSLEVGASIQVDDSWREDIRRAFEEEWCVPLKESGLPHRTMLLEGRPATAIGKAAEQLGADLVVVGRRGRGGVARLLLGSVSSELTQDCPVPVVVLSPRST